jgi:hypothetical protein
MKNVLERVKAAHPDFDDLSSFDEIPLPWYVDILPQTLRCYPKLPKGVWVRRLMEWIGDGELDGTLGYYAIGHWEPQSFAIAANLEHFNDGNEPACYVSAVRHKYQVKCACDDDDPEDPCECFCNATERTPGAFAVTIVEF